MSEPKGLTFPCHFPIKIIGKAHQDLQGEIMLILKEHAPEFSSDNLSLKKSRDENFHALTANVYAESKEQLDNIYRALTQHKLITMVL